MFAGNISLIQHFQLKRIFADKFFYA